MSYIRLNKNANCLEEVTTYYQDRAKQLIFDDFIWTKQIEEIKIDNIPVAAKTTFVKNYQPYNSYYIYKNHRNKGIYKTIVPTTEQIITVPDCNLEKFLKENNYDYIIANTCETKFENEYNLISQMYGSTQAKRSKIPYMYHIDEGCYVLKQIKASDDTIKAYILHPIFQLDESLEILGRNIAAKIEPAITMFVMEYRNIANAYLSPRKITSIEEIMLSPLKEVNDMLIADKIQNYKDFLEHHLLSHPRKKELNQYFNNWLDKLNLDINFVSKMMNNISR